MTITFTNISSETWNEDLRINMLSESSFHRALKDIVKKHHDTPNNENFLFGTTKFEIVDKGGKKRGYGHVKSNVFAGRQDYELHILEYPFE